IGLLVLVPELVETLRGPVVAVFGTMAWIWVIAVAVALVLATPLNFTATGLVKLPQPTRMVVPRAPVPGETLRTEVREPGTKKLLDVVTDSKALDLIIA